VNEDGRRFVTDKIRFRRDTFGVPKVKMPIQPVRWTRICCDRGAAHGAVRGTASFIGDGDAFGDGWDWRYRLLGLVFGCGVCPF